MPFSQMVESLRTKSGEKAFRRALLASRLAHLAGCGSRTLRTVKDKALERAVALAPEKVTVSIDAEWQIGLPSYSWKGIGRMHRLNA